MILELLAAATIYCNPYQECGNNSYLYQPQYEREIDKEGFLYQERLRNQEMFKRDREYLEKLKEKLRNYDDRY